MLEKNNICTLLHELKIIKASKNKYFETSVTISLNLN